MSGAPGGKAATAVSWWKQELHTALELADELLATAEDAKERRCS